MITRDIPIKDIKVIENIRLKDKGLDKEKNFLMQSIKDNGLLQPIGVKESTIGYTLIWGFRRLDACKKLGFRSIPAVIFVTKDEELTEEEFFVLNATENLQRRNNTLLEFGRVCAILKKTMSSGEIAIKLGVPKSRVESALVEISRIPLKYQRRIKIMNGEKERNGEIPLSVASKIASLRGITDKQKEQLLELVMREETESVKITGIASLMKKGMTFNQAKEALGRYRTVNLKVMVDYKKFKEYVKDEGVSESDILLKALNLYFKDDEFAINLSERRGLSRIKSEDEVQEL